MKPLAPLLLAGGGSVLMMWLALTNLALAWLAMIAIAGTAIGCIVLIARRTHRDPLRGLPVPNSEGSTGPVPVAPEGALTLEEGTSS